MNCADCKNIGKKDLCLTCMDMAKHERDDTYAEKPRSIN